MTTGVRRAAPVSTGRALPALDPAREIVRLCFADSYRSSNPAPPSELTAS